MVNNGATAGATHAAMVARLKIHFYEQEGLVRSLLLGATALVLTASAAHAEPLVAGSTVALSGTTAAAEPNLAGTVLADEIASFTLNDIGGTLTGSIQSRVVRSIDGTLDFYWRVFGLEQLPGATGQPAIGNFRIGNFGTTVAGLNANYRIDGTGDIGPASAHAFSGSQASFVNFIFGGDGLRVGSSSLFMFLDTTATHYDRSAIMDVANIGTSRGSNLLSTFAPVAVPEPASWALMIGGLGLVGGALRRRKVTVAYA